MAKFKVGDRVRVVWVEPGDQAKIGMVGTVMGEQCVPYVAIDGYAGGHEGSGAWGERSDIRAIREWQLELVTDRSDTAERDQLAREFALLIYQDNEGYDESAGETWEEWISDICEGAFDFAEAFLAERAKRTTEN